MNKTKILLFIFGFTALYCHAQEKDMYESELSELLEITPPRASVVGLGHHVEKGSGFVSVSNFNVVFNDILFHNTQVSEERILEDGFVYAPKEMKSSYTDLQFMYAPGDKVTLMLRGRHVSRSLLMSKNSFGATRDIDMTSSGFGDLSITSNFTVIHQDNHMLLVNIGANIPTGSISESYTKEDGEIERYPYIMQTGSGTIDPVYEAVYLNSNHRASFGAGMQAIQRYYDNKFGYHLGNEMKAVIGYGYNLTPWFGTTVRVDYQYQDNILGADSTLQVMESVSHRPDMARGHRVDASLGMIFTVGKGTFKGLGFKIDYRYPIEQNYSGFGMKNEYNWKATIQWAIGENQLAVFKNLK